MVTTTTISSSSTTTTTTTATTTDVVVTSSSSIQQLLSNIVECIEQEEWRKVVTLIEENPSLARQNVTMTCQGEETICTLLHLVCGTKCYIHSDYPPIFVLDELVSMNPSALVTRDSSGGRLPIHMLLLKQGPTPPIPLIQFFINCCRPTKTIINQHQWSIQDNDGNVPLHYAAMYSSSSSKIFQMILSTYPNACSIVNYKSHRTPLHLLCARWSTKVTTTTTITKRSLLSLSLDVSTNTCETIFSSRTLSSLSLSSSLSSSSLDDDESYKNSKNNDNYSINDTTEDIQCVLNICNNNKHSILSVQDKYGRLPLHLLVDQAYPRWDIIQIVIQEYPNALLIKDNAKRTPYDLAKFAQNQYHGSSNKNKNKNNKKTTTTCKATKLQLSILKDYTFIGRIQQFLKINKSYKLQKQTNNNLQKGKWIMKNDPDCHTYF